MKYPRIVEDYWYSIDWDVESLWALDLPATPMPVEALAWHLDVPIWPRDGRPYSLTPREVAADPGRFGEEYARTMRADLGYPIEIFWNRDRWMILDGIHRLLKAAGMGKQAILARRVPPYAITQICE